MKRYHLEHSLPSELADVHNDMINTYELEQKAQSDAARAKVMEGYLRKFKQLGKNKNQNKGCKQCSCRKTTDKTFYQHSCEHNSHIK